ncbi:MAG: hypothetical protein QW727_01850 [Candidatus Pacearchaeota archaeon]
MFGKKCFNCNNKISKKYEYCPYCGVNLSSKIDEKEYGFLGKKDFDELGIKFPFGFNALMKPLMKELSKQMIELDKELKKEEEEQKKNKKIVNSNFTIHIGIPGQIPIKVSSVIPSSNTEKVILPKIRDEKLVNVKNFPRKEPKTNVRRLSDKVIYEIELPGVNSIDDININKLENGFEIKAIGKKEIFVKNLDVSLPLRKYELKGQSLNLELGLR